jgi:hypothetical protein
MININAYGQLSPVITSWLQNTTQTGTYYVNGNSTAINNNVLVNCQQVKYSDNWVYITATGMPAYPNGPFLDGNPSQAQNQNRTTKFPMAPTQNTGTLSATTGGNIGLLINGVALFDYRDGVAWNSNTNALCGGPGNPPCPGGPMATQNWNRDAIPAEMDGFDCSKGHPANGNYHHHQNPSAFKLDKTVVSTICNLYDADGLYVMDEEVHSPLIGYAYDGFPIYGAFGYKNANGSGGITRIKSGYKLRNITVRTHHADGTDVPDGPIVNSTYPIGYFREDYEFITHQGEEEYLDKHNGRYCITPEYPNGTYAYFATVDENLNSAYPYAVGPTFYGNKVAQVVTTINETTTTYNGSTTSLSDAEFDKMNFHVFPNPSSDFIAVQMEGITKKDMDVQLLDANGFMINQTKLNKGQTIAYFDTQTLYAGVYFVLISVDGQVKTTKVIIEK